MENNNQYLRFSAYSIKDLITRKLSEDSKFTDQIYEGSNLAILIDLVSYMYQCLMYQLNTAAAESMWSDTQIYENINRLCKFIGYNPKGFSPSTAAFTITDNKNKSDADYTQVNNTAYKYSAIDTEKTDANGKKVYYSLVKDEQVQSLYEGSFVFYNGLWKLYPTIFTSSGEAYQTFTLNGLESNADNKKYVSEQFIHVYIKDSHTSDGKFDKWEATSDGLFMDSDIDNGTYIHQSTDKIYNVRLNENKIYELTFGNNTTGEIPEKGAQIYIMYLDSNDETVELEPLEIQDKKIMHNKSLFGLTSDVYKGIFGFEDNNNADDIQTSSSDGPSDNIPTIYLTTWSNTEKSSVGRVEETVEEIRRNAPQWFKTGNRLVTASDYEYFIKNRFKSDILDVKCQNNAEYISTFYRWLYNIGIKIHKNGSYYVTPHRIVKHDLHYADAADANNVYIWIKMLDDAEIYKEVLNSEIQGVKTLTHEPVYLKPITLYFSPCAQDVEDARKMFFSNDTTMFDEKNFSYIEVTIENNTLYANSNIQQRIAQIVQDFFNEQQFRLGQVVNTNDLIDKIFEIGSISNIRTVYFNTETSDKRILNGISFATWSASVIDSGDDLDISSSSKSLEPFQFPKLYNAENIVNKIKVIRKAINNVNTVQY